ncbi:conserved Plasmodium protein, unknown function [Plasmodium ovale curtisi]|uniref:RNA-editing substrate-binding complex 6 protein domain-containing protein n=2 Tax=Plasmodium ovale TaxID=36330 RepID=A0A1A8WEQ5_PLAOA|nr:conserved Plasmodium protein, unknown function [Plasmodium ovale curtisi]SBS89669.1 conserved Plasmodium protein, unknown function [Plasmodium ovale curtisi]
MMCHTDKVATGTMLKHIYLRIMNMQKGLKRKGIINQFKVSPKGKKKGIGGEEENYFEQYQKEGTQKKGKESHFTSNDHGKETEPSVHERRCREVEMEAIFSTKSTMCGSGNTGSISTNGKRKDKGNCPNGGGEITSREGIETRKDLELILKYASTQIIKSLSVNHDYINCKDYFMSLALICNQLAIHKFEDKSFWYSLSIKLTNILKIQKRNVGKTLCIRWLALILNSFGRVHVINTCFLKEASSYIKLCKGEDVHTFDISQIVNAFSKLNYVDRSLFKHLEPFIFEKIDELSCQSIGNICNAYSKLEPYDTHLVNHLSIKIKKSINKFNEQELANVLNSFAKCNIRDLDLFNTSLKCIFHKFYNFKPIEIVMITNAYSKFNIYNKTFFSYLFSYIKNYSTHFKPPELAIIANAYANFNLREYKIFHIIKNGIVKKEYLLENGNVAMLLHAYGKLLIRDEQFILNLLNKKKKVINFLDCRNLTLFYVSIIKLNIDIPRDIYINLKLNISKKLHSFTDLALVSICYSSMFYMYFDMNLIASILLLLNKRKASSKSFAHQIHVSLFVLQSLYDFGKFSLNFLTCLLQLLNRSYHYISQPNYYDINKSAIQKRISPFIPKKKNLHVQSEVPIGPFVVDFLLCRNDAQR